MNRTLIITIAMLAAFATSNCASSRTSTMDVVNADVHNVSGYPAKYYSDPETFELHKQSKRDAFEIASGAAKEVKNVLKYYKLEDVFVDTKVTRTTLTNGKDVIDLNMTWSVPTAFFPPGEYHIEKAIRPGSKDALKFASVTKNMTKYVAQKLDKAGIDYNLHAEFSGTADGIKVKGKGIPYGFEFGDIDMSPALTSLNGQPKSFKIRRGDFINNEELAALRAYSLRYYVLTKLDPRISLSHSYSLNTTSQAGAKHRRASVTFRIKEAK